MYHTSPVPAKGLPVGLQPHQNCCTDLRKPYASNRRKRTTAVQKNSRVMVRVQKTGRPVFQYQQDHRESVGRFSSKKEGSLRKSGWPHARTLLSLSFGPLLLTKKRAACTVRQGQ
ncbi:hypothetical protein M9H77_18098 [Catharanthus roseus]|uniref:Uncharacterized protein n=1 Tax=Catharanthus roseus TaxID=4058 RepID=A0ACC0B6H7_CATRO|nr:hypothetical protein M9H77_18098 [Catharanthus roseus]